MRRAGFQNQAGKSVACVTPAGRRDTPRRVAPGWVTTDRVTEQHWGPRGLWTCSFYDVCVCVRAVVYWCVRSLFSFPLLCASTFCSLRLPTEYERNGRYEGSRWGNDFLNTFYRSIPHFCWGRIAAWGPHTRTGKHVRPAATCRRARPTPRAAPRPGGHMRAPRGPPVKAWSQPPPWPWVKIPPLLPGP